MNNLNPDTWSLAARLIALAIMAAAGVAAWLVFYFADRDNRVIKPLRQCLLLLVICQGAPALAMLAVAAVLTPFIVLLR